MYTKIKNHNCCMDGSILYNIDVTSMNLGNAYRGSCPVTLLYTVYPLYGDNVGDLQ